MRFSSAGLVPCGALCALSLIALDAACAQDAAKQAAASAQPHYPTTDDLRHLKAMGAPLLSPDGAQVLFTVTEATADGGKTHLWLAPVSGSESARQITFSAPSEKRGER